MILDLLELDARLPRRRARRASARSGRASRPTRTCSCGIPRGALPARRAVAGGDARRARGACSAATCASPTGGRSRSCAASRQYLYDETGRAYLDVYNNVPHVGHCHPRVVRAAQEQLALLNTNTRYLHDIVAALRRAADARCCPSRCASATSSTRAARRTSWRCASRARTPAASDVIVLEHAYHGHTTTLVDMSPYKFDGPGRARARAVGARGAAARRYRGPLPARRPAGGAEVRAARSARSSSGSRREGRGLARVPRRDAAERRRADRASRPATWRRPTATCARPAASCIADEVQTGFGRLGDALLGLRDAGRGARHRGARQADRQRLPARRGGHHAARSPPPSTTAWSSSAPSAATRSRARRASRCSTCSRRSGCRSTRCASGERLLAGLRELQERHAADRRRARRRACSSASSWCATARRSSRPPRRRPTWSNRLRERGVLTGTDGPYHNVLKLRPPLVFSEDDAELFLAIARRGAAGGRGEP